MHDSVRQHSIANLIYVVRGHRVMLDSDLASLYGVPTKRLNEQVKRNRARFPEDFGFRLTASEVLDLRSQIATSNVGPGGRGSDFVQPPTDPLVSAQQSPRRLLFRR